jgi:uncharacterized membrane protein YbaN (DUF454 family)
MSPLKLVSNSMRGFIQYIALFFVAITSIVVGIAGIVLPFLPGFLLILIGLVLLSLLNPWVETKLHQVTEKYPPVHKVVLELRAVISRIIGKK